MNVLLASSLPSSVAANPMSIGVGLAIMATLLPTTARRTQSRHPLMCKCSPGCSKAKSMSRSRPSCCWTPLGAESYLLFPRADGRSNINEFFHLRRRACIEKQTNRSRNIFWGSTFETAVAMQRTHGNPQPTEELSLPPHSPLDTRRRRVPPTTWPPLQEITIHPFLREASVPECPWSVPPRSPARCTRRGNMTSRFF